MDATARRRPSAARRPSDVSFRPLSEQFKTHEDAAAAVRSWCKKHEGSVLKAWLKHFDPENDQSIGAHEFNRGLRMMGYAGLGQELLRVLDEDGSGGVSLAEIDPTSAKLW